MAVLPKEPEMLKLSTTEPEFLNSIYQGLQPIDMVPVSSTVEEVRASDEHSIVFVRYIKGQFTYANAANPEIIAALRAEASLPHGSVNGFLRANVTHPKDRPASECVKFEAKP